MRFAFVASNVYEPGFVDGSTALTLWQKLQPTPSFATGSSTFASPVTCASGAWHGRHDDSIVSPCFSFASARNAWKTGLVHDVAWPDAAHCARSVPWQAPHTCDGREAPGAAAAGAT